MSKNEIEELMQNLKAISVIASKSRGCIHYQVLIGKVSEDYLQIEALNK